VKVACGVFGACAPDRDVAHDTYDGTFALQHRGQESAGMAVAEGETITAVKDTGLVASVYDDRTLFGLTDSHAIGYARSSTAGSMDWTSAQPVYRPVGPSGFALAHNGNLTNTTELAEELGVLPGLELTDSDALAELISRSFPHEAGGVDALQGGPSGRPVSGRGRIPPDFHRK